MAENENAPAEGATPSGEAATAPDESAAPQAATDESAAPQAAADTPAPAPEQAPAEDISYHAVEKDGQVTAIWEMQGRKHLRTIDPRSRQGQEILRLYTAEHEQQ